MTWMLAPLALAWFLTAIPRRTPPLVHCRECGAPWRSFDPSRRCPRCRRDSALALGLTPTSGPLRDLPDDLFGQQSTR